MFKSSPNLIGNMHFFQLIQTLNNPDNPNEDQLAKREILTDPSN